MLECYIKKPPLLLLILRNASKRNALTNGLLARKTLNAFLPFKTAKRSVEPRPLAGVYALPPTEVRLPSMLLNALKLMDAFHPPYRIIDLRLP